MYKYIGIHPNNAWIIVNVYNVQQNTQMVPPPKKERLVSKKPMPCNIEVHETALFVTFTGELFGCILCIQSSIWICIHIFFFIVTYYLPSYLKNKHEALQKKNTS